MTEQLKPCPFCGAPAAIKKNKTTLVSCTSCTAATFQTLHYDASAIQDWNRRVSDDDEPITMGR